MRLQGSLVAIVTPMHDDGSLDYAALRRLLDFHLDQQTDGIVIVGTTGESPTVSVDEHLGLIEATVKHIQGRIPVIAGTGANSTSEAIELTAAAKKLGADAALLVAPYYNKPSQEGLYQHYRKIAESVDIPQILYNVPGRTGVDLHNDTSLRLAQIERIVGIKDATGSIERATDLIMRAPKQFAVYSGDDASAMPLILLGGQGVISVTANVAPKLMHDMCQAALVHDVSLACEINQRLFGLHQSLFVEANPIPVKWALQQMKLIAGGIRLPLVALSSQHHAKVLAAMQQAGITL